MMPVAELATLRTRTHEWSDVVLHEHENPLAAINAHLLDLETEFRVAAGAEICVTVRGFRVVYDAAAASLSACGTVTGLRPLDGVVRLRILLDLTSIEVYGNDGRVYIPRVVFPEDGNHSIGMTCRTGTATAHYIRVHEMKSSWQPR